MRLVLDTNVLLAAFLTRGFCHELFEHCLRVHRVVTSNHLLDELQGKLVKKAKYSGSEAKAATGLVRVASEVIVPTPLPAQVCRDPDGDWVLATAKTGRCRCIVTGDNDLLSLGGFEDIAILKPGDFWSYEQRSQ